MDIRKTKAAWRREVSARMKADVKAGTVVGEIPEGIRPFFNERADWSVHAPKSFVDSLKEGFPGEGAYKKLAVIRMILQRPSEILPPKKGRPIALLERTFEYGGERWLIGLDSKEDGPRLGVSEITVAFLLPADDEEACGRIDEGWPERVRIRERKE